MPIVEPTGGKGPWQYVIAGFQGGIHSEFMLSKQALDDTECSSAHNVEFWPLGVVAKRTSTMCLNYDPWPNATCAAPITEIYNYFTPAGTSILLAWHPSINALGCSADIAEVGMGGAVTAGSATFTTLVSGSQLMTGGCGYAAWTYEATGANADIVKVEAFAGRLFVVDGRSPLICGDGTPWFDYCCGAPSAAKFVKLFSGSLFLANVMDNTILAPTFGTRVDSRIYWSYPNDPSTPGTCGVVTASPSWPEANYMDLDQDDGDRISGMETLGSELIVFKENKIFAVQWVGGVYGFSAEKRVEGKGCVADKGVIGKYGDLVFYGNDGVYKFDGRNVTEIGHNIKDSFLSINPVYRGNAILQEYEDKCQIWMVCPLGPSTTNNRVFIYDYANNNWTGEEIAVAGMGDWLQADDLIWNNMLEAWTWYSSMTWGDKTLTKNSALMVLGSYDGHLLVGDSGGGADWSSTSSGMSADIDGFWRSKWVDMGDPYITKRIMRATVFCERMGDYDMEFNVYKDWDDAAVSVAKTFSLSGATPVLERRLDFTMQCRAMKFELRTRLANQPFKVHKVIIEYYPKGKTQVI